MTSYDSKKVKKNFLATDSKWATNTLSTLKIIFLNSLARDVSPDTPDTLDMTHIWAFSILNFLVLVLDLDRPTAVVKYNTMKLITKIDIKYC